VVPFHAGRIKIMRLYLAFCWLLLPFLAGASPTVAASPDTAGGAVQNDGPGPGGEPDVSPPQSDSIWLVSTRGVSCGGSAPAAVEDFRFVRYDRSQGCQPSTWEAWADDPFTGLTLIYVHGNRIESNEVLQHGLNAYRALGRNGAEAQPVRFVIWSWPSGKVPGPHPRRDAQVKAARTHGESYLLASFIARMAPDAPLALLGYSFGGRIVSGALHLTAGGTLGRYQLVDETPRPEHSIRAALLAPGMDNSWWLPGAYHGKCFAQVDRLLLLYNTRDPVLRLYSRLGPGRNAPALGYTGFCWTSRLGENAARLAQVNVCSRIGKTHKEDAYFASEGNRRDVRESLLAP